MSYQVIRVYSFGCDWYGCDTTEEIQEPSLPEALRALREAARWY